MTMNIQGKEFLPVRFAAENAAGRRTKLDREDAKQFLDAVSFSFGITMTEGESQKALDDFIAAADKNGDGHLQLEEGKGERRFIKQFLNQFVSSHRNQVPSATDEAEDTTAPSSEGTDSADEAGSETATSDAPSAAEEEEAPSADSSDEAPSAEEEAPSADDETSEADTETGLRLPEGDNPNRLAQFFRAACGQDPEAFVDACFLSILGHEGTEEQTRHFISVLNANIANPNRTLLLAVNDVYTKIKELTEVKTADEE